MSGLIRLKPLTEELLHIHVDSIRVAEDRRHVEIRAAIIIQAAWRSYYTRRCLGRLRATAITIQSAWRAYKGRVRFAGIVEDRNRRDRKAYFDHAATEIQRWWRGFYSRKHIHDFYKRKAYLAVVQARNDALRRVASAEAQQVLEQQRQQQEQEARALFDASINRMGHMRSTSTVPGIFNSPQARALGTLPLAGGLAVEEHIRQASRIRAKKLAPLQLAPPAPNMPDGTFNSSLTLRQSAGYTAVREAAALEGKVDRSQVVWRHGRMFTSVMHRKTGRGTGG